MNRIILGIAPVTQWSFPASITSKMDDNIICNWIFLTLNLDVAPMLHCTNYRDSSSHHLSNQRYENKLKKKNWIPFNKEIKIAKQFFCRQIFNLLEEGERLLLILHFSGQKKFLRSVFKSRINSFKTLEGGRDGFAFL